MASEERDRPRADLKALQERLNEDAVLKQRFLENPGETLRAEGYVLTPEQEHKVTYMVDRLKTPGALIEGSGIVPPGDLKAITITIGVDF
jgi:hypothetical protein